MVYFMMAKLLANRTKACKLPTYICSSVLANDFASFFKGNGRCSVLISSLLFLMDKLHRIIGKSPAKPCSLGPVLTWMVKGATDIIATSIRDILNTSMSNGTLPKSLKTAIISLLLKKLSLHHEVMSNYRPVTNMPFLSNRLEK